MSSTQHVLYNVSNHVALLTLNQPAAYNAFTPPLLKALTEALQTADHDPQVRVVILTGAGKGFCAGANLQHGADSLPTVPAERGSRVYDLLMDQYLPLIRSIVKSSKIVIGAINGPAAGAGASLALACDLRIMADSAYLLEAFINIALVPDAGGTWLLPRYVGYPRALEMCLEGKPVSAQQCLAWGLANRVVPAAELAQKAREWAESLAQKSPAALSLTKRALQHAHSHSLDQSFEFEATLQQFLFTHEDFTEGVSAFFSRRKPQFSGKPVPIPRGIVSKL